MNEEVPENLKKAAIFQLVSGLVNMFVLPTLIWTGISVCTAVTFGFGGVLGICGMFSCLLGPIGIFEVIAGGVGLANPKSGGQLMRFATYAEFASILGGGIHSAVVGYLVSNMLDGAEVQMVLEG